MYVCEQAHLRKVISQQLLDGRCLKDVDAHTGNVRHRLGPAAKQPDLCLRMTLSLVHKGIWPLIQTASQRQGFACLARFWVAAVVTVLQAGLSLWQSEWISVVALR